ncbi:MAG: RNA polymerase-binding protein DksA [Polaromonas sp.]|nr:RNA polymerase-binding protein DksA [Polaromonas sp.]
MPAQTPAKPGAKAPVKAAAKPAAKAAPAVARPAPKAPVKSAKPVSTPPAATSVKEAKAEPVTKSATQTAVPATPAPAPRQTLLPPPPPLKPGRRSSARTAAHSPPPAPMVPTHAPDAAKASYSTMTERVIAPPPHVAAKKDPKLANNWKAKSGDELTDEEVKAMPDTEYMNDKQLAFFRHKLSILKQDIHNSAGETTEHLREDTVVVPDPADRATIEEEHALELRTRDRERKLLKKIEQSIARIDSGDYGYCDETGEPIGVGRLIARPTANLSLEAQQRRELKQKMFGD